MITNMLLYQKSPSCKIRLGGHMHDGEYQQACTLCESFHTIQRGHHEGHHNHKESQGTSWSFLSPMIQRGHLLATIVVKEAYNGAAKGRPSLKGKSNVESHGFKAQAWQKISSKTLIIHYKYTSLLWESVWASPIQLNSVRILFKKTYLN